MHQTLNVIKLLWYVHNILYKHAQLHFGEKTKSCIPNWAIDTRKLTLECFPLFKVFFCPLNCIENEGILHQWKYFKRCNGATEICQEGAESQIYPQRTEMLRKIRAKFFFDGIWWLKKRQSSLSPLLGCTSEAVIRYIQSFLVERVICDNIVQRVMSVFSPRLCCNFCALFLKGKCL